MNVVMRKRQKKVLPFPKPSEDPAVRTITIQVGRESFAIHWELEELPPAVPPPAAPLVLLKRPAKNATAEIVESSPAACLPSRPGSRNLPFDGYKGMNVKTK